MPSSFSRRLLRWRLRLLDFTRPSGIEATLAWAGIVGLVGGLCGVAFREALDFLHFIFTNHTGDLAETARDLAGWQRVLVPTLGALGAGLVVYFGMHLARGAPATDFMEAIVVGDGTVRARPTLLRSASSLLTLASGGSIGREGPMVQLAAMSASALGRALRVSQPQLRLMVACGAAAGIASAYKAPIAGALFVAEIVLGSIAMQSFGPLIFSSVVATLVSRFFSDARPIFDVPRFELVSLFEVIPYLMLGVVAGVCAPLFLRLLRVSERLFARLPGPIFVRFTVGGLCVGLISLYLPDVWGNGYSVVSSVLRTDWLWYLLLQVLVLKLLATGATVGSGAFGGVFTPTLFVGGVIGCLFGQLLQVAWPGDVASPNAYALVGMGCVLAGTTHAPLMAILMIFEMTLSYEVVLPLMLACVTSYYAAHRLDPRSVYARALGARRGTGSPPRTALQLRVADVLRPAPPRVARNTSFEELTDAFSGRAATELYVVDDEGRLVGAIAVADIKPYLDDAALANLVIASDLMHAAQAITPEASLLDAMQRLRDSDGKYLPVVDSLESLRLVGSISSNDVLFTLAHGEAPHS